MKERGEKNCHKCCKGNRSPLPTSRPMPGQCPSNSHLGSQTLSPHLSSSSTSVFIAEYPFGQLRSAVLAASPSSLLSTTSLLAGEEREKALTLFSSSQNVVCYQLCFGHKCEAYHHADCYEKINSIAASTAGENAAGRAGGNAAYSCELLDQLSHLWDWSPILQSEEEYILKWPRVEAFPLRRDKYTGTR